jgi:hypothetical protein
MKKIAVFLLIFILTNVCGASPTLIKFILIGEESYQKIILKSQDPSLLENNFMICPQATNQAIFLDSVYKRIESYPTNMLPIIISTYANFEVINTTIKDTIRFPKRNILNIVISYVGGGNVYPVGYNTNEKIDTSMILVGGGNDSCDFTWGNKLNFTSRVKIQYINGSGIPVTQYVIDSIYTQSYPNRVYSPILSSQAVWGTPIWLRLKNSLGDSIVTRLTVGTDHGGGTYVTTAPINMPGSFVSGTAVVNWRSGAVVYIAFDLKKIMDGRHCSFLEAVACAEATGSNNGIWKIKNGYGQINVQLAINYVLQ